MLLKFCVYSLLLNWKGKWNCFFNAVEEELDSHRLKRGFFLPCYVKKLTSEMVILGFT